MKLKELFGAFFAKPVDFRQPVDLSQLKPQKMPERPRSELMRRPGALIPISGAPRSLEWPVMYTASIYAGDQWRETQVFSPYGERS